MLLVPLALTSRSESEEDELPALAACRRVRGLMVIDALRDCAARRCGVWRTRDNGLWLIVPADDRMDRQW